MVPQTRRQQGRSRPSSQHCQAQGTAAHRDAFCRRQTGVWAGRRCSSVSGLLVPGMGQVRARHAAGQRSSEKGWGIAERGQRCLRRAGEAGAWLQNVDLRASLMAECPLQNVISVTGP